MPNATSLSEHSPSQMFFSIFGVKHKSKWAVCEIKLMGEGQKCLPYQRLNKVQCPRSIYQGNMWKQLLASFIYLITSSPGPFTTCPGQPIPQKARLSFSISRLGLADGSSWTAAQEWEKESVMRGKACWTAARLLSMSHFFSLALEQCKPSDH